MSDLNRPTAPITVCIPTIPPRVQVPPVAGGISLLQRAVNSVHAQILQPAGGISVALDVNHAGAAATRQRALDAVRTDWVAFLDDDDLWYPNHLETLWRLAQDNSADYVYSWFDGNDPFPKHRGRQMDVDDPHHTTMTVMVRTWIAKQAGFTPHPEANTEWPGEDWYFTQRCIEIIKGYWGDQAGKHFAGTGDVTWHYQLHPGNTSGLGSRW